MKQIIKITGKAGGGKTTWANAIYDAIAKTKQHVVILDDGQLTKNNKPDSDPKDADVTIICKATSGKLKAVTV